ncbi:MAG: hypothetical protein ACXWLT_14215 [Rhizomicrobium sp.]
MPESEPDNQENNDVKTLIGLAVAIVLVVVTVFLLMELKQGTATLDCIAAGHHNCEPIDTSKM